MTGAFAARLMASGGAFVFATLAFAAARTLALVPGRPLGGIPIAALYYAIAFAPLWLLDAMLLRPLLLDRFGWVVLAPVELLGFIAYRCLVQAPSLARTSGSATSDLIADMTGQAALLYGFYLLASVILLRRHAAGDGRPPTP